MLNASASKVLNGKLLVCNQEYKIQNLAPGKSKTFHFAAMGGVPAYKISFNFSSRHIVSKEKGYVCAPLRNRAFLTVRSEEDVQIYEDVQ